MKHQWLFLEVPQARQPTSQILALGDYWFPYFLRWAQGSNLLGIAPTGFQDPRITVLPAHRVVTNYAADKALSLFVYRFVVSPFKIAMQFWEEEQAKNSKVSAEQKRSAKA